MKHLSPEDMSREKPIARLKALESTRAATGADHAET